MTIPKGYMCSCCGEWHNEVPLAFGYDLPTYAAQINKNERRDRVVANADFCTIDERDYFVRGVIEIPIIDYDKKLEWGVWVSLSKRNFERMTDLLTNESRVNEPPYFGWLSNGIPLYTPTTLNLKTHVWTQAVGLRPLIELEPTDHPLAIEQRNGITIERLQQIIAQVIHAR